MRILLMFHPRPLCTNDKNLPSRWGNPKTKFLNTWKIVLRCDDTAYCICYQ